MTPFLPFVAADDEADLAKELPRIKGKNPKEAMNAFKLHDGFQLIQAASEPLITDPVSVAYDADGRAYVVEMRGYPYPENQPTGNVTLLTNTNGDGIFDKSVIFVEGLSWPTGVVPFDGGVYIQVAPDIIYAKDTDGDGKADIKRTVFTGFGTQNVQGLLNNMLWGMDGWIYGSAGTNGGEIKNLTKPGSPIVSVRGRDFRFKPDASVFEAISNGGQFGHSIDDWGHRFSSMNSNHIRQVVLPASDLERNPLANTGPTTIDIAVEGGASPVFRISEAEPWRIVRTRQRKADPVLSKKLAPTELFAFGFFTSATGVTIYRGTALPEAYRGNAFIGDVGGNLVHRKIVEKDGPIFKATRADQNVEFLASPDNWFRPVNFTNTPSGTLLIIDMYRETIEHPASIPEPIKKHLDLTSGKDRGRLYELAPTNFKRRPQPKLSKASNLELVATLADPDAWWRDTAQRLLIERNAKDVTDALIALAKERKTPLARAHALWTLDALGSVPAELLVAAMNDENENVREVGAKLAGVHPGAEAALVSLAKDPIAMVRFQAALSLGNVKDAKALEALAEIARRSDGNRWTRAAVMSSISGRADGLLKAIVAGGVKNLPGASAWVDDLAFLIGAENRTNQVAQLLDEMVRPDVDQKIARSVLLGVGRGLKRSGKSLSDVLPGLTTLKPYFDAAEKTAKTSGPVGDRLQAIQILSLAGFGQVSEPLGGLLDTKEPTTVQVGALQALSSYNDPKVAAIVLNQWKALSPAVRREAIEAMFARPERIEALLGAIERKEASANDIDPTRQAALLKNKNAKIRQRAQKLLGQASKSDRTKVIMAFKPALSLEGKLEKGRAVFKQVCATCHKAENMGIDVGPNLATVTNRSPEDLLVHILDPNREVPATYINYSVATVDGRVLTGLIAEESASALTLKRAEGASDVVPRDRIEQISASGQSLMPEGLEKGLQPQDFADLIAFLKGIQAKR
jgi:putative membrane-bound dehydrogenase-like protein